MANGESREKLEDTYKFVYECDKCKLKYGSDKKELKEHICPICPLSVKFPTDNWINVFIYSAGWKSDFLCLKCL